MEEYLAPTILVTGFIVLDIASGYIAAMVNRELSSTVMRRGIYHKVAELLAMATILALNVGVGYLDFGVEIPLYEGFCGALVVMELTSIAENLCKVNPELSELPFFNRFKDK